MTDKQIIIDGVDVSECDFLAKEDDYCSYSGETRAYKGQCGCSDEEMCKDHPNCFYKKALKQLKAKEQECERLKSDLTDLSKIIDCKNGTILTFKEQLDQLKIENEELKKDVIEALKLVEITSTHNTFQESRINKLSKTLTEIKEIAEKVKGYDPLAKQILQKISEVEND